MMSFATDRIAEWAIRRADRVRPVSLVLADRARAAGYAGPIDRYVAFSDYSSFLEEPLAPLPESPRALFVGVLEDYKAVDVLLDAWPSVLRDLPDARLTIVGGGSLRAELESRIRAEGLDTSVTMVAPVDRSEIVALMDAVLVPGPALALGRPRPHRPGGHGPGHGRSSPRAWAASTKSSRTRSTDGSSKPRTPSRSRRPWSTCSAIVTGRRRWARSHAVGSSFGIRWPNTTPGWGAWRTGSDSCDECLPFVSLLFSIRALCSGFRTHRVSAT